MTKQIKTLFEWWLKKSFFPKLFWFVFVFAALAVLVLIWLLIRPFVRKPKEEPIKENNVDALETLETVYEEEFKNSKEKEKEFIGRIKEQHEKREELDKQREEDAKATNDAHDDIDNADDLDSVTEAINRARREGRIPIRRSVRKSSAPKGRSRGKATGK